MKTTSLGMRGVAVADEVVLRTFEDADFAFRSPAFDNGETYDGMRVPAAQGRLNAPLLGDTLTAIDGTDHFDRRRIEAQLFRAAALDYYESERVAPMIHAALPAVGNDGEPIHADLLQLTRGLLTTITAAIVGLDGVDSPAETERFVKLMDAVAEGATGVYFDDRSAAVARGVAARQEIVDRYFVPAMQRRRHLLTRSPEQVTAHPDLLVLYLLHAEHFGQWEPDLLFREMALYVRGSAHTTTNGLSHVVAELDEWMSSRPDDRTRLSDPEFLGRAFEEAIRLHPSTPMQWLVARERVTFPSTGRSVPAGETVAVSFVDVNRDPTVFGPDADRFDPDRRLPERVRRHGLAFGGGVHSCIGKPLVLGAQRHGDGTRQGTAKLILRALYARGVRPDPDRPAVPHPEMTGHYASFPVVFGGA